MKRHEITQRPDWQSRVEEVGLTYHTPEGQKYWDESAYYELTAPEVDNLEKAANDLHELCIRAAEEVIERNRFAELGIPPEAVPYIKNSWERDDFSLYGRFDLACTGMDAPKLLEYNADTPTALVEAAVAQWYWLQDVFPKRDQFNSIHERLVDAWKKFPARDARIYFGGVKENSEDAQTVLYLRDTCHQAGLKTDSLFIEDLGFHSMKRRFVDGSEQEVLNYFKLYPWEWMWHEVFAEHLKLEVCTFIEPMWKMLLSNKGLLPILWEMFPGHPNLLPAFFDQSRATAALGGNFVRKPKLSREGANISRFENGRITAETAGEYGEEGYVYQGLASEMNFEGNHPIFGVWIVNHTACGLGIREDKGLITGNCSRFMPHLF